MPASGPVVTGAETTLTIRHVPGSAPVAFQIMRLRDGKTSPPVTVTPPAGFPVEGRPTDLLAELQWYLEEFLNYPYSPETEHADRVLKALREWGEQAFQTLFGNR